MKSDGPPVYLYSDHPFLYYLWYSQLSAGARGAEDSAG